MIEYVDAFREEAKSLFSAYKNKEKDAVARCAEVFGDKTDLTLMNIQHVIAKEYGFNQWNDIIKAESWQLAEMLVLNKNKTFVSPLKKWWGGKTVSGYEKGVYHLHKPEDYKLDMEKCCSGSLDKYISFEHLDVSSYDLSKLDILRIRYSEDTKWSEDKAKLPFGFNPKEFLEKRKNSGLGIRELHKQGICGQGRVIVMISPFRLFDHLEYHYSLKGYEEIHIDEENYGGGSNGGRVSAVVGKTCGVAPMADIYYYAVDDTNRTQRYYAEAMKKACLLHHKLKQEGKSGVDVIAILRGLSHPLFKNEEGFDEMAAAVNEAEKLGIWCYIGTAKFKENGMWREERIHCPQNGDVDNFRDYVLSEYSVLHKIPESQIQLFRNSLCFPSGGNTHALDVKMNEYAFDYAEGSFTQSYAAGLYLLAKSVKSDLTPVEFWRLGLKTGDFREGIGVIVNPQRLIEALKR